MTLPSHGRTMHLLLSGSPAWAFACAMIGCGAEHAATRPPRPSLLDTLENPSEYPTPAQWRYHPTDPAPIRARVALSDGRVLLVGERGERWLVGGSPAQARTAAGLAPETLVAALGFEDSWSFVGESGTVYEAATPLGPIRRSSAPLEPLARVAAAGSAVVGVGHDGLLRRSDADGGAWSRTGPDGIFFVDVELLPDGRGLALSLPERLWATRDGGESWKSVDSSTFGAVALGRTEGLGVVVQSALGPHRWLPESARPFERLARGVAARELTLGARMPLGPSAVALGQGRAFVSGGRYFEARPESEGKYSLISGKISEPLSEMALGVARGCRAVRLAGFGSMMYLFCAKQTGERQSQPFEVSVSDNAGKAWTSDPYVVEGKLGELVLSVTADGTLVASGVCPPRAAGEGCRPLGVFHRRRPSGDGGTGAELVPSATPTLSGSALALTASVDGKRVFAIGSRSKDGALAVFVSHDAGRTFEAHEVREVELPDDDDPTGHAFDDRFAVLSASAAEDGTVAFVMERGDEQTVLVTDEQGRVLAYAAPPTPTAHIGAAGSRVLALSPGSRQAWESLDGGSSWESIGPTPVELCPTEADCERPVACYQGGCILGDSLSRIGWNGQAHEGAGVLSIPANPRARLRETRVRTPFTCTLDEGPWRALPERTMLPSANQAAIGKVPWFVLGHEPRTASVFVLHPRAGRSVETDRTPLLEPSHQAERTAYTFSLQVEGAAALRYETPQKPGQSSLTNLEFGWHNFVEGRQGRANLTDGGGYSPGDYENAPGPADHARPALLSIGAGGLYARIHHAAADRQPTYFFDGQRVEILPPVNWPPAALSSGRSEMAHVDGTHVPLRLSASTLVRARRAGDDWTFDAMGVAFVEPKRFGVEQFFDIAYVGDRSGLHWTVNDSGDSARSVVYPFRATGSVVDDAVPVPTQLALEADAPACSRSERTKTPRVVGPFQPGTRHPVLVADPVEPPRVLLTDDAVLHGAPTSPCAAAFDAELISGDSARRNQVERALIFPGDLEHAWLFRGAVEDGSIATVEYRTMACRLDPHVEVPVEVFRAKGTILH